MKKNKLHSSSRAGPPGSSLFGEEKPRNKSSNLGPSTLDLAKRKCKPSDSDDTKLKTALKILATLISLVSIALIIYTLTNTENLEQEFSTQVENYGIPSLFILSMFLELIPQLISPIMILAAGILAGINIHFAILTTIIGSTIGSTIGFALGKKYMCKAVNLTTSLESRQRVTYLTNKYGKIIVPIAAISPLPYIPVLLGAMNFSKQNFIIYGLIPRILGFIIFGYFIQTI